MPARYPIFASFILFLSGVIGMLGPGAGPLADRSEILQQPDSVAAITLFRQAVYEFRLGQNDRAYEDATQALQHAMRSGNEEAELGILDLLSAISLKLGSPGDAIPFALRKSAILESRNDTVSWRETSLRLADYYRAEEVYEKEGEYLLQAFRLTPPADLKERSRLMGALGKAAMQEDHPDSAAVCFRNMISLSERAGIDTTPAYISLAQACNKAGAYTEALSVNGILFERFREAGDTGRMISIQNNMGFNEARLGDYPTAIEHYRIALQYADASGADESTRALLLTNMGTCSQNMGDQKGALAYFRQAIDQLGNAGDYAEKSRVENMVALIFYHSGDLYNAGLFSRQAIESANLAANEERLSEAYLTYSRVLREGNDPIKALEYYEKYLGIRDSVQMERKVEEQELSRRKYELERSEKELRLKLKEEEVKELAIQQLTLQLEKEEQEKELLRREKDLEQLEKERLRQSLEITRQRHEAEKQERENQILEQENRIKDLRLREEEQKQREQQQEIALLEQQKQLDKLELERQRTTRNAMILIIILVAVVALLILAGLISVRKKNLLLARQKQEIQEKNTDLEMKNEEISAQRDEIEAQRNMLMDQKERIQEIHSEITKSIEYARRIQSSTLPGTEGLTALFHDHFLLFRPRDIVSGDFYWLATLENATVLTVVDCTGHGVPGAFMSMLGMSLLKEIVVKEYITQPAVILRRMRKEVITALSQKGTAGEQRDGMDLALISIHHDTGIMEYAGANNSLYLVRQKDQPAPPVVKGQPLTAEKSGDVLYEIPADKMPIALYDRMDKFTNHEIPILEGDRVYLFTDGYADQFGGSEGKKFMYKHFKRQILAEASRPMKDQLDSLGRALDEWMGDSEQIDDICVMGIRI